VSKARTRTNERGGGTLTAWNDDVKAIQHCEIGKDSLLSKLIFKNHILLFLLNVYRSNVDSFKALFNEVYAKLPLELWKNLSAIGDFNLDMLEESDAKQIFLKYIKV